MWWKKNTPESQARGSGKPPAEDSAAPPAAPPESKPATSVTNKPEAPAAKGPAPTPAAPAVPAPTPPAPAPSKPVPVAADRPGSTPSERPQLPGVSAQKVLAVPGPAPLVPVPALKAVPPPASRTRIGVTLVVRGDIEADEDVVAEGRIEGSIDASGHAVVVERHAKVSAPVLASAVTIRGTVNGRVTASEQVSIESSGVVAGDIVSPRIAIADGATFNGKVDTKATDAALRVARYRREKKAAGNS